ncbi:unnamed protein product [Blepharisma stoltei]|uniref:EF-hand domain-containing protein n=1 Tax=Blepharisma stoltei TaxID=1481888 RepID=A0AAU9J863_9CILI|nr:unnamed protein product [Blepharisma stoltei]
MINKDWRSLLCSLISMIYEGESDIEICREFLCKDRNFNPYNLLGMIPQSSGVITPNDFYHCNLIKDLKATFDDFYMLIKQYSSGANSYLTSKDFLKLIMPATNEKLKKNCLNQKLSYSYKLDKHTSFGFQTLIRKEIDLHRKIEKIKMELENLSDFSVRVAFLTIDKENKGFIDSADLFRFLKSDGTIINSNSFEDFFRRIKREKARRISLEKFYEMLTPYKSNNEIGLNTENSEKLKINAQETLSTGEEYTGIQESSLKAEEIFQEDLNSINEEVKDESLENDQELLEFNQKVLNYFFLQLNLEMKIENYRESLFMFKEFSIDFLFKVLDKYEELEISIEEFDSFLKELNIDAEKDDLVRIFKKFGNDNIKLEEEGLDNLLRPLNDEYEQSYRINSELGFSPLCIEILSNVFKLIIESEKKIAEEGMELAKFPETYFKSSFKAIDSNSDGIISIYDMKIALDKFGIYSTNKEIELVMKRYRIYMENGISYEAFYQSIAYD